MEIWKNWLRMEIVTVTFNDGNSIYKILLPDFSLPLDKVSGKISVNLLTQTKELLWSFAVGELRLSLKCQSSEVVSFWLIAKWNSQTGQRTIFGTQKVLVIEYTAFGIPESKLYSRWAGDAQMPWPRSSEYKNHFLKVSTCGSFIIHWPLLTYILQGWIKNPKIFKRQKSALLSYSCIY